MPNADDDSAAAELKTDDETAAVKHKNSATAPKKPATPRTEKTSRGKASKSKGNTLADSPPVSHDYIPGQSTHIMDLPPEIRNDIWTLAIVQQQPIDVAPIRPFLKEPALLAVNRQVRSETMSVWYAEHAFQIMGSVPAVKFLRSRADQQLRSLRSVRITSEKSEMMRKAPRAWIEHLRKRIESLMWEFEERGLRKSALKFQLMEEGQLSWYSADSVEIAGVTGPPDKGKKIRGGPRKGMTVPGSATQG